MYSFTEFFYVAGMIGLGVFMSDVLHSAFRYGVSLWVAKRLLKKYQSLQPLRYIDVAGDSEPGNQLPPSKLN